MRYAFPAAGNIKRLMNWNSFEKIGDRSDTITELEPVVAILREVVTLIEKEGAVAA